MDGSGDSYLNILFSRMTPSFRLTSLESSISVEDRFNALSSLSLESSPTGALDLMAKEDVFLALYGITMIDLAPEYQRSNLFAFATNNVTAIDQTVQGDIIPAITEPSLSNRIDPLSRPSLEPARIYALDGSVCAYRSGQCIPGLGPAGLPTHITLPMSIDIYAGLDVRSGWYTVQNNHPIDYSSIQAGRDIYETYFYVGGVGDAMMQAGRDIILYDGSSRPPYPQIIATGDLNYQQQPFNNALSPSQAADITLIAGMQAGADYKAFENAYLDPDNKQGVAHIYLPELNDYMQKLGYGPMSGTELLAAFNQLPLVRQEIFLDSVYMTELKQCGIDYNNPQSQDYQSYDRGFKAASLLFPTNPAALKPGQGGNIILNAQPVQAFSEGDITMLAPYGRIQVGSETENGSSNSGGVVTDRGGNISMMADQNIDLFTSRVFTLEGGDLTMWTSDGSITAGSGASTTVLYKPLQFFTDNDAVVTVNAFGLSTGAGIGVLDALEGYDPNRQKSLLDLIAPRGEVNAGDAGIRVVGDINIAARTVVGVENIQVSGSSAGIPKVQAPNIGTLTSASQATQAASKEAIASSPSDQSTQSRIEELPSIITVEVVGYEATDEKDKKKK
jgi:hypothetical protein